MYWQRDKSGRVKIFYTINGKQVAVPRLLTKLLDSESDHNINASLESLIHKAKLRGRYQGLGITDRVLLKHVDGYAHYLRGRRKAERTVRQHRQCLLQYSLPFLCLNESYNPPQHWEPMAPKLLRQKEARYPTRG